MLPLTGDVSCNAVCSNIEQENQSVSWCCLLFSSVLVLTSCSLLLAALQFCCCCCYCFSSLSSYYYYSPYSALTPVSFCRLKEHFILFRGSLTELMLHYEDPIYMLIYIAKKTNKLIFLFQLLSFF